MSPMKRASTVDGLKRGIGTAGPAALDTPEVRTPAADLPAPVLPPSRRPKPPKPVRFTLDLDEVRHRFLKGYADEIEAKGASQVMRALLDELQADPELAARIRTRVWEQE